MLYLLRSAPVRAGLIALVTFVAYGSAMDAGFIWDDDDYITQNPVLRDAWGLFRIWFDPTSLPQYYPVVHTSFWVEFQLWGIAPRGYHVVNVLLHIVNAWLVLRVLTVLRVPGALFAAFVFALHPVHVESVAWVTERKNVLSATFYLLALLAWVRWRPIESRAEDDPTATPSRRGGVVALALFVGALLSKTVTCSLPAVILLLIYWKRGRVDRRDVVATLPFFAIGLALASVTAWLEKIHVKADGADFIFTVGERILIAGHAVWFYAGKLLWPAELIFNYPRWDLDTPALVQWAFPIAALGLIIGLFAARHRIGRGPLVAALIFGGTLAPALGFVNVFPMRYSFVADHFQYLASLGVIALVAAALARVLAPRLPEGALVGAAVVCLGVLGWKTSQQGRIYESQELLWVDTLERNPASWMACINLAKLAIDRGEPEVASEHLERGLTIHETFEMHLNLGVAQLSLGKRDNALQHFERSMAMRPDRAEPKVNVASMYVARGRAAEALPLIEEALAIAPDSANGLATHGQILHALGRSAAGLAELKRALALDPRSVSVLESASDVAADVGDMDLAIQYAASAFVFSQAAPGPARRLAKHFAVGIAEEQPAQAAAVATQLFRQLGQPGRAVAEDVVRRLRSPGPDGRPLAAPQAAAIRAALGL